MFKWEKTHTHKKKIFTPIWDPISTSHISVNHKYILVDVTMSHLHAVAPNLQPFSNWQKKDFLGIGQKWKFTIPNTLNHGHWNSKMLTPSGVSTQQGDMLKLIFYSPRIFSFPVLLAQNIFDRNLNDNRKAHMWTRLHFYDFEEGL